MNTVESKTETPHGFRQALQVRAHTLHADVTEPSGGTDSAPGPHDYFDAALVACKTLTAMWYAKRNKLDLERVEARVERDDREERKGTYRLKVRLAYHGNLTEADRARIHDAVSRCPIHKLMTTTEVVIETEPLEPLAPATAPAAG